MEDDCPPLTYLEVIFWIIKGWSSEEKIQYIMELQEKRIIKKRNMIEFGYTRVDTLDRLMKKYGYNKIDGKFVLTVRGQLSSACVQNGVFQLLKKFVLQMRHPVI